MTTEFTVGGPVGEGAARPPMEEFTVAKYEGAGNEFLVLLCPVRPRAKNLDIADSRFASTKVREGLAKRWCDRDRGLLGGADGLIFGLHEPDFKSVLHRQLYRDAVPGMSAAPLARMVLHNADGSQAEMSGNGLRCLAHALVRDPDYLPAPEDGWSWNFLTDAGSRYVLVGEQEWQKDKPHDYPFVGALAEPIVVGLEMGRVGDGPDVSDAQETLARKLGAVQVESRTVGNPHLVVHVPDSAEPVTPTMVNRIGRHLARADEPDHATNVEFIGNVCNDDGTPLAGSVPGNPRPRADNASSTALDTAGIDHANAIGMLVWERGVGQTQACGTGAVAASECAVRWGLADQSTAVRVHMLGGDLMVKFHRRGAVLVGPSRHLGQETVSLPTGELSLLVDLFLERS